MYLPPVITGNAYFLQLLRGLLVQDLDLDDDGVPEALRLAFATPRAWLAAGKQIEVERMPTAFGPISYAIRSQEAGDEIVVSVQPPPRLPTSLRLRLRLPEPAQVVQARIGSARLPVAGDGTIDLSERSEPYELRCRVARSKAP
jgi:hypothetical protein